MSLDFRNAKICSPSSLSKHSKGCIEPGRYHGGKYFPLFFNREKLPFFFNESALFSGLKVLFFLDRLNYQWQDSKKKSVIFLNCDDQWWQKQGAFFPTKLKVWGHSPHNWSQWHSATEAPLIHHNMQHDWAGKTVILFPVGMFGMKKFRYRYTGNNIPVIPVYRYFGLVKSWVLLDLQNHEMDEKSQNIEL